jgi:hypothetical protein
MPKASGTAEAPRLGRSGTGSITLFNIQPNDIGAEVVGQDFHLLPPAGVAAVMAWWGVLQSRVVQIRHRAGVGAAWRQPSRSPRQSPPAVTVMARCVSGGAALHRSLAAPEPVQLCRQRPGAMLQVLQVAVAVERPAVDAARLAAPVAGLRSARTGVVGLRPAGAAAALPEPGSGRDGDLPGPARLPAGHQVSPPLAWLPGSDQLITQAHTAEPEPHGRAATVLPGGGTCRRRSGCGWRPEGATAGRVLCHGSLLRHQVGVGPRPYVCALTRQVWPVDQAISPSPRSGRDVAGQTTGRCQRQPGAARATPAAVHYHGRAGLASPRSSPWLGAAGRKPSLGLASRSGSGRDATCGSASSVGIGRRLAPAQATLPEPCRSAPLDARLEAQHPSFERH